MNLLAILRDNRAEALGILRDCGHADVPNRLHLSPRTKALHRRRPAETHTWTRTTGLTNMSATETQGASATADPPGDGQEGPRAAAEAGRADARAARTDRAVHAAGAVAVEADQAEVAEHRDDFDAAARLALVEAAQAFNPRRGVKFPTFARFRILGAIRDLERYLVQQGLSPPAPQHRAGLPLRPGRGRGAGCSC